MLYNVPIPLTNIGVESEFSCTLLHSPGCGDVRSNTDHHPPLGELTSKLLVLLASGIQIIQALREHFLGRPSQLNPSLVNSHARDDVQSFHHVNKVLTLVCLLVQSLILKDDP